MAYQRDVIELIFNLVRMYYATDIVISIQSTKIIGIQFFLNISFHDGMSKNIFQFMCIIIVIFPFLLEITKEFDVAKNKI